MDGAMDGIGVVLINLGTPSAPTPAAVRRYLAEFLADRRVIDMPGLIWWPILHGLILRTRPARSARAYARIWDEGWDAGQDDGEERAAPLAVITARQAAALQARLGPPVRVIWAMRYGAPALAAALPRLAAQVGRILFVPLYPQYCAATTGSAMDAIGTALRAMRHQPAIRTLPPYYNDPAYIAALRSDIVHQLAGLDFVPDVLLLSFHGMPESTYRLGDPYYDQCCITTEALRQALATPCPDMRIELAFQSRFGRAAWLEPATDMILQEEAQSGTQHLAVVAPGFAGDCLETREELAIRGRACFLAAGGRNFAMLTCLNDSAAGMEMLETLVRRELAGWI